MSHRRAKVARELREKLAEILAYRVRDPRLNAVTIVEVRPSPDFSFARVFYSTLGDRPETAAALDRAKPFLRRCLAEAIQLRRVPELDMRFDESPERAARLETLLDEIAAERETREDGVEGAAETESPGSEEPSRTGAIPAGGPLEEGFEK